MKYLLHDLDDELFPRTTHRKKYAAHTFNLNAPILNQLQPKTACPVLHGSICIVHQYPDMAYAIGSHRMAKLQVGEGKRSGAEY